jgi:hypothetical protein
MTRLVPIDAKRDKKVRIVRLRLSAVDVESGPVSIIKGAALKICCPEE